MDAFTNTLSSGAAIYGIDLSDSALKTMSGYTSLVREHSLRMNLVSRGDLDRFVPYHLLDALKTACCVDYNRANSLLDFGSGAGIPGIPFAIAFPHLSITLVESRLKRADFLEMAVKNLSLHNVNVIRARLESLDNHHVYNYDIISTRATVTLSDFYLLAARFLSSSGLLVSIKGDNIEKEFTSCESIIDHNLFNMFSCIPPFVDTVRSGHVVILQRKVVNITDILI